ncbi:abortive infection family protein [Bacillus mobilis]|uniref:abortive infection family protein n=1 Tax=Bacillus mobilis TaxID=2026190 RepID=UPI0036A34DA3
MNSRSALFLESCKNKLRITFEDYNSSNSIDFYFNTYLSNEEYREARQMIFRLRKEMEITNVSNDAIKECRDVEEYIRYISFSLELAYQEQFAYISRSFNDYIDYIEENNIDVKIVYVECDVPKELKYTHIMDNIIKCEKRIENGDYAGALTSARSLIEGVCKEILYNITNEEIKDKHDLPKLFDMVRNHLNLDPSNTQLQKSLKGVISGLIKVVQGLNEIRNSGGDSHIPKYNVSLHHALLVVNSAKTVATFLFHTYEYQREKGKIVTVN